MNISLEKPVSASLDNDTVWVKINFDDISVTTEEVINSLGYNNAENSAGARQPDKLITGMVDEALSRIEKYCVFEAGYRIIKVHYSSEKKDGLLIGDKFFRMQKIVAGQLRKAEKAALFVCTIGPGMENRARQLQREGEFVLSYVVNTIASVVVEKAVDFLHDYIGMQMNKSGLKITNRYSPGYCGWPVSEQHLLFSFLPEKFCGVSLTDSALMMPIKSVSGIIGIGSSVKRKEYTCDTCGIKECTYRSKRAARQAVH
jgi:copper chaperone CopZ